MTEHDTGSGDGGDRRCISSDTELSIAAIDTVVLRIPFTSGHESVSAVWGPAGLAAVDTVLVKITTVQGVVGWGEAFGFRATPVVRHAVDDVIAPMCIGRDARLVGPLMSEVQHKLGVFGRGGPLTFALSAVDIALWDIVGKAAGLPLHRMLGGGVEDVKSYASLDAYGRPPLVAAAVRRAIDAGFTSIKLHETEFDAIRAARDEAGPDIELSVDAGLAWEVSDAEVRARALKHLDLAWLEEPVWPPENLDGLARVRRAGIPIAAGENVGTLLEFERMMAAKAVDVIQPSPAKMGGITELVKVFPVAAVHNVPVMVHSFYDGPGLLAAIHATAALGGRDAMVEWRFLDLHAHVFSDALAVERGRIRVPSGPGLGIDPDPDVVRAFHVG